jgi:hypothetical protein
MFMRGREIDTAGDALAILRDRMVTLRKGDAAMSDKITAIDPTRLDLAREFKRNPFKKHSPDLYALLETLRSPRFIGNYLCVIIEPHKSFALAIKQADGKPPVILDNEIYGSREEVEWAAFKRRWEAAAGAKLEIE